MNREYKLRLLKNQLTSIINRLGASEDFVIGKLGSATQNSQNEQRSFFVNGEVYSEDIPEIDKISGDSLIIFSLTNHLEILKRIENNTTVINVVIAHESNLIATLYEAGHNYSIHAIAVIGEDIAFQMPLGKDFLYSDSLKKTSQAFGKLTTGILANLTIGVAGISGTGSIVAEQLYRMQIGKLILIDDDVVEETNLGRIINSSKKDSEIGINKAVMMKKRFDEYGLGSIVVALPAVVLSDVAIRELAQCDIVFGCVDSVDGRHHLNLISSYYVLPYFDVGVKLVADGEGGVSEVTTAAHYIIPGESSLMDRGVYNSSTLANADLLRKDFVEYNKRLEEKYIQGGGESSPAVISVNMAAASMVVIEMLSRIHPFRDRDNSPIETVFLDLTAPRMMTEQVSTPSPFFRKYLGKGDVDPLIGLPK